MNVLFLTLVDISTINERGIYHDLIREFIRQKHNIFVVSPSEKRYNEKTRIINDSGCKILKVKTGNIQKTNIIEKGISTILLEKQFINAIKKHLSNERFDLVIYTTPPITLVKVIEYIKKKHGALSYLLLKDIFPQNAVDLGMFSEKGIIHRYFRKKESKLYQISDHIGCMSQANVEYVVCHNPDVIDKVHVSPNSIEPICVPVEKIEKEIVRGRCGIPLNKKVFLYGGNLGKPQDIPFIIECLKQLHNKDDIFFVICGNGTEYDKLNRYINETKPNNIKLINSLPKAEYDKLATACDVGLIFLDKRFTIPNFPSRLLSYMENYMPVLACTDTNTDIGKAILDGGFGWWCESSDPNIFTDLINTISDEEISIKGQNARKYLDLNYTVEKSYHIITDKVCS